MYLLTYLRTILHFLAPFAMWVLARKFAKPSFIREGPKVGRIVIPGEFFSASSKAFLKFDSDSPANLDIISGPLMRKKNAPVSLATALARRVLPVPGGPNMRIPRGGFTPEIRQLFETRHGTLSNFSTISISTFSKKKFQYQDQYCLWKTFRPVYLFFQYFSIYCSTSDGNHRKITSIIIGGL